LHYEEKNEPQKKIFHTIIILSKII
jgi:hypothetical protein